MLEGRAQASYQPLEEVRQQAMAIESIKRTVDPGDIAALTVFLTSAAAKSMSGPMLPINNDMQSTS